MVPGFDGFELVEGAAFFFEDHGSRLGPDERFRRDVVAVQVFDNRIFEIGNAGEDTAPNALAGDFSEEPFDKVEPGGARRREVQLEARMFAEPRLDLSRFVRGIVVEHQMHVEMFLHAAVDPFQEPDKLLGTMARLASPACYRMGFEFVCWSENRWQWFVRPQDAFIG